MKKQQPMFSVYMLCYNHEQYVAQAIESVLEQTCNDFEFIIADNGSTDNSWEVIQRYDDSRIQRFQLEKNDIKKCTELCVEMTTGKYLAQMSSDDYWYPKKLELQKKAIEDNPECYAFFTWASFTDEKMNVIQSDLFSYENRTNDEWFLATFFYGTVLAVNTMVAINDKQKWIDYFVSVMNYRQLPDQKEFLDMFLNGDKIYVVQEQGMKIRRHENCIGVINQETYIRTINETISIWIEIWNKMSDSFFLLAFKEYLIDNNVSDPIDILCERMLVLLAISNIKTEHQTLAMSYFAINYMKPGVSERLISKYHYSIGDFYKYSGKNGIGALYSQLAMKNEKESSTELKKVLELLLKYNENILAKLDVEENESLFFEIKNNYYNNIIEVQKIFKQYDIFSKTNIHKLEEIEINKTSIQELKIILLEENIALRKFKEEAK